MNLIYTAATPLSRSLRLAGTAGKRIAAVVLISLGFLHADIASAQGLDSTWATKNTLELRAALTKFYTETYGNDDASSIRQWFSPGYIQVSDGKILSYSKFLAHLKTLKMATKSMRFEVLDAAYTGDTLADRHLVHIVKANGATMDFEVLAFFRIKDGKFYALNEHSRVINGGDGDSNLGSRIE